MVWKTSRTPIFLLVALLVAVSVGAAYVFFFRAEPRGWLDLKSVKVASDEGYLYVLLHTAGRGAPDWQRSGFAIAFDVYDRERGERKLPPPVRARVASGVEFLLMLQGPAESRLRVTPPYQPYALENPVYSPRKSTGEFVELPFYSNAERYTRDGRYFPARVIDRGIIRFGSLDPRSPQFDTLTDVAVGNGTIEIRLPWNLLNVTDPSMRRVIHSDKTRSRLPGRIETIGTIVTDGVRVYAFSFDPSLARPRTIDRIPKWNQTAPLYTWATWETPRYKLELKAGADLMRRTLESIPDHPGGEP